MSSLADRARRAQILQAAANIHPEVRKAVAEEALNSQKSILAFPYYSTVRVEAVRSGSFTWTVTAGERKCFNYKIGDSGGGRAALPGNGFNTTYVMTAAETNLLQPSQTRDNADVLIWGIAAEVRPGSDPILVRDVWRNSYVKMALSGTDSHTLGRLSFFPSAGGLYGSAPTRLFVADVLSSYGPMLGHMNNGNPTAGNYFKLPAPVRWEANGSGKKDTSLVISLVNDNPIALSSPESATSSTYTTTDRSATAPSSGSTGQAAWTSPADGLVFADITFRLISISISERSTNS